jgi:hypothetical protein
MEKTAEDTEISVLKEILKWVRFAGLKEVKTVLTVELDTDQKKQVYQLSDGTKSNAEINSISGVSTGSISGYWKKWRRLGLGETKDVTGGDRFVRAFDLEDFGILVPPCTPKKPKEKTAKETTKQENVETKG